MELHHQASSPRSPKLKHLFRGVSVVFDCSLFDARINWNPAGILSELDGQNMRLSYLGELDAECRRIFYVVGRDEMADGAPRLKAFPRNRNFGFFDTMCCDNTDAFAFKSDWIVRFLNFRRCSLPGTVARKCIFIFGKDGRSSY